MFQVRDMNQVLMTKTEDENQLYEVVLGCVAALEAGGEFDRDAWLQAHPKFRRELQAFFEAHDLMERVAAPVRAVTKGKVGEKSFLSRPGSVQGQCQSAGEPAAGMPALGQLGEFRLLREVGRGGMGVVYEALQLSLQRRVAVKVLPFAAGIDPRRLQRFKNEALAAAHLCHENIVSVHAVGADRGVHYYAMPFIEGQSLAALIGDLRRFTGGAEPVPDSPSKPQPIPESACPPGGAGPETRANDTSPYAATSISRDLSSGSRRYYDWVAGLGRQAALALEHAHQVGIIHRDIKPANLLLDPRGQIWITDFGLAQVGVDGGLTLTGELLGTLRYASPEQTRGRPGLVDHRTDIYSLAATLYELLTLRPLFEGRDRNELLQRIADEEPRLPRALRPSVPGDLETVLLKALAKDAADRYATAQEMALDLERFLEYRPILARRPTLAERMRKWARRHPFVIAAGAVVCLLLLTGSLVSTVLIYNERRKTEAAYRRERLRAQEVETQFLLARFSVDELFRLSEEELAYHPGADGLRRQLLTSVRYYYQQSTMRCQGTVETQEYLRETSRRADRILADLAALRANGQLNLLSQSAVLDELRVDAPQRVKAIELSARVGRQWQQSFRDIGRLTAAERRRRSLEQARVNEADMKALLTSEQLQRLYEIGLQADVAAACKEPEVAIVLRLSEEQRDHMRTIEEEGMLDLWRAVRPDLMPADADKSLAPRQQPSRNERILGLLTTAQTRTWRNLAGVPFRGPLRLPSPFDLIGPEVDPKGSAR
jgi:serine/threonine protein kinase